MYRTADLGQELSEECRNLVNEDKKRVEVKTRGDHWPGQAEREQQPDEDSWEDVSSQPILDVAFQRGQDLILNHLLQERLCSCHLCKYICSY